MASASKDFDKPALASWRRYPFVAVILLIGVALSFAAFVLLRNGERNRVESEFREQAAMQAAALAGTADRAIEVTASIRGLFDASREVERHEFKAFTKSALTAHPEIQALYWVPRVPRQSRTAYVEAARSDGVNGFEIMELTPDEQLVVAADRDEHFPVFFVEPLGGNDRSSGYDLASEAMQRRAMEQARDTGDITATGPLRIVQEPGEQLGFLIFVPVWAKASAVGTVQERRAHLEGFAVGVLRIGELVEASFQGSSSTRTGLAIYDATDPAAELFMYSSSPGAGSRFKPPDSEQEPTSPSAVRWRTTVDIGGRQWAVVFQPVSGLSTGNLWLPWTLAIRTSDRE